MEFYKKFETRAPKYALIHRPIIERFALVGGRDEELKEQTGRAFSNIYEIYMYAAMLGIRADYRLPLEGLEAVDFSKNTILAASKLGSFHFMALLTKSGVDLNEIEDMSEDKLEDEIGGLRRLLEEYANGGFDILASKIKETPYFFENDYCFLEMLS